MIKLRTHHLPLAVLALAAMAGCGGKSISGGGSGQPTTGNELPIRVDGGPAGAIDPINALYATVTVCVPASTGCASIDHVLVDTGSTGLRLLATALPANFTPPAVNASNGNPLFECLQFADGYTWGPVHSVDVKLAGEVASSLPIQLISDSTAQPTAPGDCPNGGPQEYSVATLGANGVLGIGVFREDCGAACAAGVVAAAYYTCAASPCTGTSATLAQQVQNPVYRFASDNNGVQVQLPQLSATGAAGAAGKLVFGIGTQSNNALSATAILGVDPNFGTLQTTYGGQALANSFVDTGANALYFNDSTLTQCVGTIAPGFYCPANEQSLSAMLQGVNAQGLTGISANVSFSVGNAETLLTNNTSYHAYQNVAGTNAFGTSFSWGLPFFYGKNVYFAIEGQSTSAGMGPYLAF